MKRTLLLALLSIFLANSFYAQDPDLEKYLKRREGVKYPNVIKINTSAILFENISLQYERALAPRFSLVLSGGYKYRGDSPRIFKTTSETITFSMDEITGYHFTPELRYYLKTCEPHLLEGFYVGLYFRHTHYDSSAEFIYFPDEPPNQFYNADLALNEYGVGITLGYQFQLWERLSIDLLMFGPRFSNYHIGYEFQQTPDPQFLNDMSDYLNEVLDKFGFDYTVDLKQDGEKRASTTFGFTAVRFGFSIGFAF